MGCMITDNAPIAFECIHAIQQGNSHTINFCVYKLDVAKAYDQVDWRYLENVLVKMGFHRRWVQWMVGCVTTVRYSVLFNGVLMDSIQATRCLCQGDPLSPSLFLFVVDGLSKVLQSEASNGSLQGVPPCSRNNTAVICR
jgi:hypothetical protein